MRYFRIIVWTLFLCSISVFSQDNNIKHTIAKGETISSISQKYNVSINSIYNLNPKAKKTLHLNQVLLIPNNETPKTTNSEAVAAQQTTEINYEVLPKETLYGITKRFKTTPELLYKANPKLESEGLKTGQTIIIPSGLTKKEIAILSNNKKEETSETTNNTTHHVKAKESLYAIAKQYGVTLKELQNANPEMGNKGLSIDQVITIPSNGKLVLNETITADKDLKPKENSVSKNQLIIPVTTVNTKIEKPKEVLIVTDSPTVTTIPQTTIKEPKSDSENQTSAITHTVLTKETKYGIAKKYGITIADLEKQNPEILQGLNVDAKLNINSNVALILNPEEKEVITTEIVKTQDSTNVTLNIVNTDLIEQLIRSASDKIGTRYRSGGTTDAGFDCSGLMCSTFGSFDIQLPRTSIEQSSYGEKIDNESAQKGDLIFFRTNGKSRINHVGMVVEVVDDEIKFIHSSTHSGVIISSTKEPYYQRTFAQVNRVVK